MEINTKNNIIYKAKNSDIIKAEKIMRNIRNNIPIFSPTRIQSYKAQKKNKKLHKTLMYLHSKMFYSRLNYEIGSDDTRFYNMLNSIRKTLIGNCFEYACITKAFLEANGYKNVENCAIMGFNKKKNRIIDFDHVVTVLNLNKTKKHDNKNKKFNKATRRDLLKPNNKTIIIDSWAGLVGQAKSMLPKYRGEIALEFKPHDIHQIFLLPYKTLNVSDDVLYYINPNYNEPKQKVKKSSLPKRILATIQKLIFNQT